MMPRVRLRVRHTEIAPHLRCLYTQANRPGESFEFPILRLMTTTVFEVRKGGQVVEEIHEQAILDTGAWITVIEYALWSRLDRLGLIEFLPPPRGAPAPRALIGSHRGEYRMGRLQMGLLDRDEPNRPRRMPALPVTAQLLTDPQYRLPFPVLLGFHGGVLDGRTLRRDPVLGFDATRPHDRTDAGPRFAQQWYLETV